MYGTAPAVHVEPRQVLELGDLGAEGAEDRARERHGEHPARLEHRRPRSDRRRRRVSHVAAGDDAERAGRRPARRGRRRPAAARTRRGARAAASRGSRPASTPRSPARRATGAASPRPAWCECAPTPRRARRPRRRPRSAPRRCANRSAHVGEPIAVDDALPLVVLHRRDAHQAVGALVEAGRRAVALRAPDAAGVQQQRRRPRAPGPWRASPRPRRGRGAPVAPVAARSRAWHAASAAACPVLSSDCWPASLSGWPGVLVAHRGEHPARRGHRELGGDVVGPLARSARTR